MTAVLPTRVESVLEASDDDLRLAARNAVAASGFTYKQLRQQAKRGQFATTQARLAWVVVGGLADFV